MSTQLIDLLHQPLPLRLLRARQLSAQPDEPALAAEFALPLQYPASSALARFELTERLLSARRREHAALEAE